MTLKVAKKLVESDYKNHRVQDPTRITSKQENQIKKYVKDFFDKVVAQKRAHDKKKEELRAKRKKEGQAVESPPPVTATDTKKEDLSDGEPELSEDEGGDKAKLESPVPITPADPLLNGDGGLKRKRDPDNGTYEMGEAADEATPTKRQKSETPPPPPPPPPLNILLPASREVSDYVAMDSVMEIDESFSYGTTNFNKGINSTYPDVSREEPPTMAEALPPSPTLMNQIQTGGPNAKAEDLGNQPATSLDNGSLARRLTFEHERDKGFASEHFQGVRGIEVHQGS